MTDGQRVHHRREIDLTVLIDHAKFAALDDQHIAAAP